MKIENSFVVDLAPQETWKLLLDLPSIVPCMPGAELPSAENDRTYLGRVKVKLGPAAVAFQGKAELTVVDAATHAVWVGASGAELKGRGNAADNVVFRLWPAGDATRVDVATDLTLAGAVAQYGRAQGVIAGVAQVLIDQFAANLRQHLADRSPNHSVLSADIRPSANQPTLPRAADSISVGSLIVAYIRHLFSRAPRGSVR